MNRFLRQIQPVCITTCIFKKMQINAEVVFMISWTENTDVLSSDFVKIISLFHFHLRMDLLKD